MNELFPEFQLVALLGSVIGSGLFIQILCAEGVAIIWTASTVTGISTTLLSQTLLSWTRSMGMIATVYILCRDGKSQMALASCFVSSMIGKFQLIYIRFQVKHADY